jgi:D-alanine transaminase
VAPRDHRFPKGVQPTAVITVRKLDPLPEAARRDGVRVITTPDLRWARCDVKSLNLLANVLAREEARVAGVFEAILVRDGHVTEGSVSNVFCVINGAVVTSPTDPSILPGITRAATLELIRREGIRLVERVVGVEELRRAEEVFLTGTTVEIVPVVAVDGAAIGKGLPGPVAQRLAQGFAAMVRAECAPAAAPVRGGAARRKRTR